VREAGSGATNNGRSTRNRSSNTVSECDQPIRSAITVAGIVGHAAKLADLPNPRQPELRAVGLFTSSTHGGRARSCAGLGSSGCDYERHLGAG
jgi:hypothetical protein